MDWAGWGGGKGAETQTWQGSVLAEKDLLPSSMSSKIPATLRGGCNPDVTGELKSCPALHRCASVRKVCANSFVGCVGPNAGKSSFQIWKPRICCTGFLVCLYLLGSSDVLTGE